MGKILLISQNETDTWFVNGISIGIRQARNIVGTKIKELLKNKCDGMSDEDFKTKFLLAYGSNYEESLNRVLNNIEIPKEKMFNKIIDFFKKNLNVDIDKEYFFDRNLKNVLVNDSRMVVAEYETEARALEVKKEIDEMIISNYQNGKPIIIMLPKE